VDLGSTAMWLYIVLLLLALFLVIRARASKGQRRKLAKKVVVVTGGGQGIGRAIALRFAREQAEVCIWDLPSQQQAMDETKHLVEAAGGVCRAFAVDITNSHMVKELVALMETSGASIEVLINNAGVAVKKPFLEHTEQELERTLKVNTLGPMLVCQAVMPLMEKRGSGHVVVVSSLMDSMVACDLSVYTASKWAVTAWVECLRWELQVACSPIALTVVRPWIVATPMFKDAHFFSHYMRHLIPPTTPEAVAEATLSAVLSNSASVTVPSQMAVMGYAYQLLPRSIAAWVNEITGARDLITGPRPASKKTKAE